MGRIERTSILWNANDGTSHTLGTYVIDEWMEPPHDYWMPPYEPYEPIEFPHEPFEINPYQPIDLMPVEPFELTDEFDLGPVGFPNHF